MNWTPHTTEDIERMLGALGLEDPSELFSHLPSDLLVSGELGLPEGLSEPEVVDVVADYGSRNRSGLVCFAGAGVYDHFLPPVVRALTLRPEFVTSYTPYQPEVSQGVLQALYEYQSMVCALTGMEVANASLYDGATAAIEAVNLAVAHTDRDAVWVSRGLHPHHREVIRTFARARDITVTEHPLAGGRTAWAPDAGPPPAAVVVAQPNYLGVIEDYQRALGVAREHEAVAICAVDPMAMGVLRRPGEAGYDVCYAEGQPLGNPPSFGGPLLGIFATRAAFMRRLPGRLVGRTTDRDGRVAYVLTLQAREQHIRREKASSNICTNQTLNAIAAACHLGWLGPGGLAEVGRRSGRAARYLADRLSGIDGVEMGTDAPFLREFPVLLPADPEEVVLRMADRGYLAGVPLPADYPEYPGGLLVATTERRTRAQLDAYANALREVLGDA